MKLLLNVAKTQGQPAAQFWMKIMHTDAQTLLSTSSQYTHTWNPKKLVFSGSRKWEVKDTVNRGEGRTDK